MPLFGRSGGKPTPPAEPEDPKWARSPSGHFRRFINFDPEEEGLEGKGGVFVIWHGGLRPRWVFTGASADIARSLHELADDDEVMAFEVNGGLFLTWAGIREEYRNGVVKFLNEAMDPLVENPAAYVGDDKPIPVVFPGKGHKT